MTIAMLMQNTVRAAQMANTKFLFTVPFALCAWRACNTPGQRNFHATCVMVIGRICSFKEEKNIGERAQLFFFKLFLKTIRFLQYWRQF